MSNDLVELAGQAYVYGFPLVFDLEQVQRFSDMGWAASRQRRLTRSRTRRSSLGRRTRSCRSTTTRSIRLRSWTSAAARSASGCRTRTGAITCCSSSTRGPTTSPMSGTARPAPKAAMFLLVPAGLGRRGRQRRDGHPSPDPRGHDHRPVGGRRRSRHARGPRAAGGVAAWSRPAAGAGVPQPDPAVADELRFFEQLRVWMQAFPPAERDLAFQQQFAPLGLLDARPPVSRRRTQRWRTRCAMDSRRARAPRGRAEAWRSPEVNGWKLTYHVFDYNLDFFEVGAIDDPHWKLATRPRSAYVERAAAARAGCGATTATRPPTP